MDERRSSLTMKPVMTTLASLAFMLLLSPAAEGGEMALARMPPDVQVRVAEFFERAKEKHGADAVAELRSRNGYQLKTVG